MAEKKLLVDRFGFIKPQLVEDAAGGMVMRGEFGRCDIPTENKRIYPRHIWEREIQKIQAAITEGKVLGELDHPSDGKTSLKRVSHVVTKLEMNEDGQIVGEAKICDNDHGKQLMSILKAGGSVGVSSRGMGSTAMNEAGYEIVQDDYSYMTHDCVADPAVKSSYPEFSVESKEIKKETVMETKVEAKKEETKPVVEASKADAPKVTEEKKVEAAPVVESKTETKPEVKAEETKPVAENKDTKSAPVAENKILSEAQVKEMLDAQKKELEEGFKKQLESDPKLLASKLVLEDVKKILAPVLLPEDVQTVVQAKDKEIADLKTENAGLKTKLESTAKSAKNALLLLHFEKEITESDDRKALRILVGDPKKYASHQEISDAIKAGRETLKALSEQKSGVADAEKKLREEFEKKLEENNKELSETKKKLTEAVGLARQFGLKTYVLEKVKTNPNAKKIIELSEGCKSKEEVDALLEKFSVGAPISQEYNSIRNRFSSKKDTTLVEDHLRETGNGKKASPAASSDVVVEGVEAEIADVIPGASMEHVTNLM